MLASGHDENRDYGVSEWLFQEKVDGIRCAIYNGICNRHNTNERVFSRSGKRIPNNYIRSVLSTLPTGLDGELIVVGGNFQDATTAAMTEAIEPTINWQYVVFDNFAQPDLPKLDRLKLAKTAISQWCLANPSLARHVIVLSHKLGTISQAKEFCAAIVAHGGEGAMLSDPNGQYVFRRARGTEPLLLKLKHFADCEATIIAVKLAKYVGYTNILKEVPEFSQYAKLKPKAMKALMQDEAFAERVWAYQGKPKAEAGAIIAKSTEFNHTFSIGTGFSQDLRKSIANKPDEYIGKLIKVKYIPCGTKDRPRSPVLLGFRHEADIS